MKTYFVLVTFLLLTIANLLGLNLSKSFSTHISSKERPPLYLPETKHAQILSIGYKTLLSKILWFDLLNYFGKEYASGQDYRWLGHMCNLVSDLDPKAKHVFIFCSSMLAWEGKDIESSNRMIEKGIKNNQEDWYLQYLKGFNQWYFEEDFSEAAKTFSNAATLPNAPKFLGSVASKLLASSGRLDSAILFLRDLINKTESPSAKESLRKRLNAAILGKNLQFLEEACRRYIQKTQSPAQKLSDFVDKQIITKIPKDPFRGKYIINFTTCVAESSSGKKPLTFSGKTAKTGIFKKQFAN